MTTLIVAHLVLLAIDWLTFKDSPLEPLDAPREEIEISVGKSTPAVLESTPAPEERTEELKLEKIKLKSLKSPTLRRGIAGAQSNQLKSISNVDGVETRSRRSSSNASMISTTSTRSRDNLYLKSMRKNGTAAVLSSSTPMEDPLSFTHSYDLEQPRILRPSTPISSPPLTNGSSPSPPSPMSSRLPLTPSSDNPAPETMNSKTRETSQGKLIESDLSATAPSFVPSVTKNLPASNGGEAVIVKKKSKSYNLFKSAGLETVERVERERTPSYSARESLQKSLGKK